MVYDRIHSRQAAVDAGGSVAARRLRPEFRRERPEAIFVRRVHILRTSEVGQPFSGR